MKKNILFFLLLSLFTFIVCTKNPTKPERKNPYDGQADLGNAPVTIEPTDEDTLAIDNMIFKWADQDSAETYTLWISGSDSLVRDTLGVIKYNVNADSVFPSQEGYQVKDFNTSNDSDNLYYWRVRISTPEGKWSKVESFRIKELNSINVDPDSCKINPEGKKQFSCRAVYDDDSEANITEKTTWSVKPEEKGSIDNNGLFTAGNELVTVTIVAQYKNFSDSAIVEILHGPEIDIFGNSVIIENNDTHPSTENGTDFDDVEKDSTKHQIFTIKNLGDDDLLLDGIPKINIKGTNKDDFSITELPTSPITPEQSTTFTVQFNPSETGSRVATINIKNNDADENPYTFTIQGTGTVPDIEVVPDSYDYDSVSVGSNSSKIFEITNKGNAILNVTAVEITGADESEFNIESGGNSFKLLPNENHEVEVSFTPQSASSKEATLCFTSDDPDEKNLEISLTGTGTAPEIDVRGNSTSIQNGDNEPSTEDGTDFGDVEKDSTKLQIFTIKNLGDDDLLLDGIPKINIKGTNKDDFSITELPTSPIAPEQSITFTVQFNPSETGVREAEISIKNNDVDEDPYNFNIQGTGK